MHAVLHVLLASRLGRHDGASRGPKAVRVQAVTADAEEHGEDGGDAAPDEDEQNAGDAQEERVEEGHDHGDNEAAAKDVSDGSVKVSLELGDEALLGVARLLHLDTESGLERSGGLGSQHAPVHGRVGVEDGEATAQALGNVISSGEHARGVQGGGAASSAIGIARALERVGAHLDLDSLRAGHGHVALLVPVVRLAFSRFHGEAVVHAGGSNGSSGVAIRDGGAHVDANSNRVHVGVVKAGVVRHVFLVVEVDAAHVSADVHGVQDDTVVAGGARESAEGWGFIG